MTTKRERMLARIEKHGRDLLALFPNATTKDPVRLCKRLLRMETMVHQRAENYCNGIMDSDDWERMAEGSRKRLCELLGVSLDFPLIVNGDPRGYALKIDDEWLRKQDVPLHRDWGGYGILAPDLTDD